MKKQYLQIRSCLFTISIAIIFFASIYSNVNAQSIPQLNVPVNGSTWESTTPTLSWLLSNTYTTVSFNVQLGLSPNNFTTPYLILNTTVAGSGVGSYDIPSGLLAVGVTYYWRVGYNGNYSSVSSFTPSTGNSGVTPIVLLPPTLNSPLNSAVHISLNPAFNWTSVTGAANYELQISQQSNFSVLNADVNNILNTSTVVNSLTSGTIYFWRVRAANNLGVSNWTDSYSFTTVSPLPATPTLLTPANSTGNLFASVNLTWSHSQYDSLYTVLVGVDPDFNGIFTTIQTTSNSAQLSGLGYNTTYYWKIKGTNFTGTGNWSSVFSFSTKPAPPIQPSAIQPSNGSTIPLNFLFQWNQGPTTGIASFKMEISKSQTFTSNVESYINLTDNSKMIYGLTPQTQYYWHVKSYTSTDSSDWSTTCAFNTNGNQKSIYVNVNIGSDNIPTGDGSKLKPYKTINYAINQIGGTFSGADTIFIADGAYPEVVNIPFPIVIIGSSNVQVAALNIGYLGMNLNPTFSVVVKNIGTTFYPNPTNQGNGPLSGININNYMNVWLDNVKVSNYSNTQNGIAALYIYDGQNITVTNSDFSNNLHGILIDGSRNITLSNITVNSTPPQILGTTSPVYGLYAENTTNINWTNLIFDSNDIGMGLKNVSNGTITNLRITNSGWYGSNSLQSGGGALMIGSSSALTFTNGQINENQMEAVIIDPTNLTLTMMGMIQIHPYPNQTSTNNSIDNLKFSGTYEFKNNTGGVFFASPILLITSTVNSPQFNGTFIFSDNNNSLQANFWSGIDFCLSGAVNNLYVNGAQFVNSVPYPSSHYAGPPNLSPVTNRGIMISNFTQSQSNLAPVGSQPNRVVFNNCIFDQVQGNNSYYITNLTPNRVNARNNNFSYATSQFDVENMIFDSLDVLNQPQINLGRVDYTGSIFGGKLPPTISVGSLPKAYRGASYYLPVNIVPKGNSYNYLQGKFSYDASKLNYVGYLSNASGLLNKKHWTTLSVSNTIVHNVTPPDSGFIRFYAFGNTPIDSSGILFSLNMQVLSSAPTAGQPGSTVIGGLNSSFLGNNQAVFTYNQSVINYFDPNGVVQSKGDVNLDGIVNMDDFMALLFHLLGTQIITNPLALSNADFNSDGQINQADLNALFTFLNPGVSIVSPSIASGVVTLSQISLEGNSAVIVPVNLDNAKNVNSLQLVFHYDPSKINFQSFANTLNLGDQYIQGLETHPGEAVFAVQSPSILNGTINFGDLRFNLGNNAIPVGSVVTSQYRLNGSDLKTGPSFTFGSSGVTAVENQTEIPVQFALMQNYPNPFNPATTIEFALPKAGKYTLKIYNVLGQEVASLINNELNAGYFKVTFDASRMASGIYIYRLSGNNVNMSKKMILMK